MPQYLQPCTCELIAHHAPHRLRAPPALGQLAAVHGRMHECAGMCSTAQCLNAYVPTCRCTCHGPPPSCGRGIQCSSPRIYAESPYRQPRVYPCVMITLHACAPCSAHAAMHMRQGHTFILQMQTNECLLLETLQHHLGLVTHTITSRPTTAARPPCLALLHTHTQTHIHPVAVWLLTRRQ